MEFRKNPISLARVKIVRRVLATIIGVHEAFLTRASLSRRWVMAKRDNEFEKKKKRKKEATDNSVIRARNFSFDRRRNKNKERRGRDAWNRKADTGAFFVFRSVFFFCNPRERTFFRIRSVHEMIRWDCTDLMN